MVPPGFERGIAFDPTSEGGAPISELAPRAPETVDISEMLSGGGDMVMAWEREEEEGEGEEVGGKEVSESKESPSQPQSTTEGTEMIVSICVKKIFSSRIWAVYR